MMKRQLAVLLVISLVIPLLMPLIPASVWPRLAAQPAPEIPPSNDPPPGYAPTPAAQVSSIAGAGGADILLVQTALPWQSDANTQVLSALGYAYDIVDMGNIAQTDLFRYPVILIVNDQVQAFYDQYAAQVTAFENYVNGGGTLVFFAASDGWALGTLRANLPGGVQITTPWYESNNFIANSTHPIVSGQLSDGNALTNADLFSNYCSHGYFSSLPADADVILRESNGHPTLVEYRLGQGRVIASTLTWEHNWVYHTGNSGYGTFARKALDDLFLYAFASSGVVEGIINVFPASVPADGVTTATVTLAGATPGHRVRLISSRGSLDTFASATGVANSLGRFTTTIRSATTGNAVLTALDQTTGQSFPASTAVNFAPVGGGGGGSPVIQGSISIVEVKERLPLSGWYPAINTPFLKSIFGDVLRNDVEVVVDWRGSTPDRVEFILNGTVHSVPATGQRVRFEVDMGQALRRGQNELRIVAYNASRAASQTLVYIPVSWDVPDWLTKLLSDANAADGVNASEVSIAGNQSVCPLSLCVEVEYNAPARTLDIWFRIPPKDLTSRVYVPVGKFETTGVQAFARLQFHVENQSVELRAGGRYLNEFERRRAAGFEHKGLSILGTEIDGEAYMFGRAHFDVLVLVPEAVGGGAEYEVSKTWERTWLALLYLAGLPDPTPVLRNIPVVGESVANFVARVASGYITLKGRGGAVLTYQLAPVRRFDSLDVTLGTGLEIGMQASIGVAKVKGLYTGDANTTFICLRNVVESTLLDNLFCDLVIKTGGGMEVEALGWKASVLVFPSFEKRWPESAVASLDSSMDSTVFVQTDWQLIPHILSDDYASFRSEPTAHDAFALGNANLSAASLSAQSTITSVLVSNVYTYTEPALAVRPGTDQALLLWVHPDPNKPVGQAHEIRFSRWNGATWSTPTNLTNDDRLDGAPQAAWAGDGKGVAVWQRLNDVLAPTATLDVTTTRKVEIATATYDPNANTWSPVALLTTNQALDMTPLLARNSSGNLLAVWRQNSAGLLGGDAANPDRILVAFYDTGWGAPQVAVETIPGLVDLAAGYGNNSAIVAYTRYLAAPGQITPTLQLFTSAWNGVNWSAPVQRTTDALGHRTPQILYNSSNQPLLVWLAGTELRLQNLVTGFTAALTLPPEIGVVDEFRAIQTADGDIVALFTAQQAQRDLFVAVYDQTHQLWGRPARLTNDRASESYPAPGFDASGRLLAAYAATAIHSVAQSMTTQEGETISFTIPTQGQTDLVTLAHELTRNITLSDEQFMVSDDQPLPGATITLAATVTNTGDLALSNVAVNFYDGDPTTGGVLIGGSTLATPLAAGFTATVTTTYQVPLTGGVRQLFAVADPAGQISESDENDNQAQLSAFGPDLALTSLGVNYWGGAAIDLVSQIRNLGTTPSPTTTIAFYLDSANEPVVLSDTVAEVAPGEQITLTTPWNHPDLPTGSHPIIAVVNPPALGIFAEVHWANNTFTSTIHTGPDLMLSPYAVQTTALTEPSASFTVTLANVGTAPADPVVVHLYRRGDLTSPYLLAALQAPTLNPGETASFSNELGGPLGCGLYIYANPDQSVQEISYSNNLAYAPAPDGRCASFANMPRTAIAPATVVFTDTSTGDNIFWQWDFGDGTSSTEQHPAHQYTTPGIYTVTLTVQGAEGADTYALPQAVQIYQPAQANFVASPLSGVAPLHVTFTDQSSGDISAWSWEFGDGEGSVVQNPAHLYQTPGVYSVTLSVNGAGGQSTLTRTTYITVSAPPTPTPTFTPTPTSTPTNTLVPGDTPTATVPTATPTPTATVTPDTTPAPIITIVTPTATATPTQDPGGDQPGQLFLPIVQR